MVYPVPPLQPYNRSGVGLRLGGKGRQKLRSLRGETIHLKTVAKE